MTTAIPNRCTMGRAYKNLQCPLSSDVPHTHGVANNDIDSRADILVIYTPEGERHFVDVAVRDWKDGKLEAVRNENLSADDVPF